MNGNIRGEFYEEQCSHSYKSGNLMQRSIAFISAK